MCTGLIILALLRESCSVLLISVFPQQDSTLVTGDISQHLLGLMWFSPVSFMKQEHFQTVFWRCDNFVSQNRPYCSFPEFEDSTALQDSVTAVLTKLQITSVWVHPSARRVLRAGLRPGVQEAEPADSIFV